MKVWEVAVKLEVTLAYIYGLLRAHRLPGAFKADGVWHVPEATVDTYLERRRKCRSKTSASHASAA